MRIVVPYVHLHPVTARLANRRLPGHVRVKLDADPEAYWRLFRDYWGAGEPFAVVEHDIGVHASVLRQFEDCPEPWCAFPYQGPPRLDGGDELLYRCLGCTRFGASLLADWPDFAAELPERTWGRLDAAINHSLRSSGYEVHIHWPAVHHYRRY